MSSSVRVASSTRSPTLWAWSRMPSSFHSTATRSAPIRSHAAAGSGSLAASIGSTARPTSRPTSASPASPSVTAMPTTARVDPASIAAERTAATGMPVSFASASWTSASDAPWRTLPVIAPTSQRCSASVARPNSEAAVDSRTDREPGPESPARSAKTASTSSTSSDGSSAAGGASRVDRQPSPVRRWRSAPER